MLRPEDFFPVLFLQCCHKIKGFYSWITKQNTRGKISDTDIWTAPNYQASLPHEHPTPQQSPKSTSHQEFSNQFF